MKLAILYTELSGYMAACLEAYRAQTGATLLVCARPAVKNAPFEANSFSHLGEILDRSKLGQEQIEEPVRKFGPDAVLVSGWSDPDYNRICRRLKAAGIPVVAGCDTQWTGSLRQHVAALVATWHVHRFIDVLWVTGERQRQLARALGFRGAHCWDGFYACDWEKFAEKAEILKTEGKSGKQKAESGNDEGFAGKTGKQKTEIVKSDLRPLTSDRRSFLFVGRYVEVKGIRDLAAAYRIYRTEVENAWALVCAGKGELAPLLTAAGADDRGFVQPERLPELMHEASAFVLPSQVEPWGVVVQEAAAAGLPLIVSEACGAGVHLVRDGYNGFVTEAGHPKSLASALIRMNRLSEAERQEFGRRSFELSKQYTPDRWARTLRENLAVLRSDLVACMDRHGESAAIKVRPNDLGINRRLQ